MLVSAITLRPLVWLGCAAKVREQTYLFLLEPAEKVNSRSGELAATKRIVEDQARELATLRASSAQLLGIYSPAASAQRHGGSSYLRRPEQPR